MSDAPATVGVGVIGLGFMGRTHVAAYEAAEAAGFDCNVVAVCDEQADRLGDNIPSRDRLPVRRTQTGEGAVARRRPDSTCSPLNSRRARTYTDADRLLADDDVKLVSICTPTDTHVDLAVASLRAGKHVLVEKPVAVRPADVQRLADEAANGSALCMPAMCMRFWPGWVWLKERIDAGTYGRVRSAVFQRLGSVPEWSPAFYADVERSGGALVDLHIHDADFVRWCFGDPDRVICTGSIDHVTTQYHYRGGPPHVVAEGGWVPTPGFEFRMRYTVAFDSAIADFDLSRGEPLRLTRDGRTCAVPLDPLTGYDHQVRHLVQAVTTGRRDLRVTIEEAVAVAHLLEAERRSLPGTS